MKVGIVQRVLAGYRIPLFDTIAAAVDGQLSVYAGDPRPDEMIDSDKAPQIAQRWYAQNLHLGVGKGYFCIQRDIQKWIETWNPDVLIIEANSRYLSTPSAIRRMHRQNKPVIGWGLGSGSSNFPFKRNFYRSFDAIITYSEAGRKSFQKFGIPAERIFVAYNAAARKPQDELPPNRLLRDPFHPVILSVGRLQQRKRLDLLIRACAALKDEFQSKLWIVGDGPARPELNKLAAQIYPQTRFFGPLYDEHLLEKFLGADLFVLPGTGGLALQEAMAAGLPVIAGEADGTQADLVRSGNGRIIAAGDQDGLIQTMREMLSDPTQLRAMGAHSYKIIRDEINLETMAQVFLNAIEFVSGPNST
jgi:glycosyltransferase involved in cell wall biosynthesis